jgi:hypothetical protein
MALAIALGAFLGFALGYVIKEKRHAAEIASIIRIARKVHEGIKRERAPKKGPDYAVVRTADGREYKARLPLRPC